MLNSNSRRALRSCPSSSSAAADLLAILTTDTHAASAARSIGRRSFVSLSRASNGDASRHTTTTTTSTAATALTRRAFSYGVTLRNAGPDDASKREPEQGSEAVGADGTNPKFDVDLDIEEKELDSVDEYATLEEKAALEEELENEEVEEEEYDEEDGEDGEGLGEEEIMELYNFYKAGTLAAEVTKPESPFFGLKVDDVTYELALLDQALSAYNSLGEGAEGDGALPLEGLDPASPPEITGTPEERVRQARQIYGEILPEGTLDENELTIYERLYGKAIEVDPAVGLGLGPTVDVSASLAEIEATERAMRAAESGDVQKLFKEGKGGDLEEVLYQQQEQDEVDPDELEDDVVGLDNEMSPVQLERLARSLGGDLVESGHGDAEANQNPQEHIHKTHPLTKAGKFAPSPSTVFLPEDEFKIPISSILAQFSNKQLKEVALKTFGGLGLPYSTATPRIEREIEPKPIQLEAGQSSMGEVQANTFLAVMMPGIYASVMSTLVEVRKRLGTDWLKGLMEKDGGPSILDVGGGGAAVIAWREVLKAEWAALNEANPSQGRRPPMGKATVLTGSIQLRERASVLLENTTFLPRLPDYVHVRDAPTLHDSRAPPTRKTYDIIIAPHTLWPLRESYMRKQQVQNLWSLLNPEGGVLILIEKGRPRGFEAIASARQHLLNRYISSPGSTTYENALEAVESGEERYQRKGTGMLIAPCTTHSKCPMYPTPGISKGRQDFCHFEQRFIRPPFLQRILGSNGQRNHDDVKFSYIAARRGVDLRHSGLVQDETSTADAFDGHGNPVKVPTDPEEFAAESPENVHMLSLPRMVTAPMKRTSHVILEVCTPAGNLERWTVPRSYGKQAYHDARKSSWGDLWALGAKTRLPHKPKIGGGKTGIGRKEKMERRAERKLQRVAEEMGYDLNEEAEDGKGRRRRHDLEASLDSEYNDVLGDEDGEVAGDSSSSSSGTPKPEKDFSTTTSSGKPKGRDRRLEGKKKPAWVKRWENRRERKPIDPEKAARRQAKFEEKLAEKGDDY